MIRTGAGISVDPNTFRYLRDDYPATISTQYTGPNAYKEAGNLRNGIPSVVGPDFNQTSFVLPAAVAHDVPIGLQPGYIESYNFTVQREAARGSTCRPPMWAVARSARPRFRTSMPPVLAAGCRACAVSGVWPYRHIKYFVPFNTAKYNGFQTQVTRRFGGSLLGLSYTLSRSIGYVDDTDGRLTWNWCPCCNGTRLSPVSTVHTICSFTAITTCLFGGGESCPRPKGKS